MSKIVPGGPDRKTCLNISAYSTRQCDAVLPDTSIVSMRSEDSTLIELHETATQFIYRRVCLFKQQQFNCYNHVIAHQDIIVLLRKYIDKINGRIVDNVETKRLFIF